MSVQVFVHAVVLTLFLKTVLSLALVRFWWFLVHSIHSGAKCLIPAKCRPSHKLLGNFSETFHFFGKCNFLLKEQLDVFFFSNFSYFSKKFFIFTKLWVICNNNIWQLVYLIPDFIVWDTRNVNKLIDVLAVKRSASQRSAVTRAKGKWRTIRGSSDCEEEGPNRESFFFSQKYANSRATFQKITYGQ